MRKTFDEVLSKNGTGYVVHGLLDVNGQEALQFANTEETVGLNIVTLALFYFAKKGIN